MNQNGSSMNQSLNSTRSASSPGHEAVMSDTPDATEKSKTEEEKIDRTAMELARRGQNRIHGAEEVSPESTIFSK